MTIKKAIQYTHTGAVISECEAYRYSLRRVWDDTKPVCLFIGLNPSTADAKDDDPTIRRCVDFADRWGCGTLIMANLFAFRATDPKDMLAERQKEGPANNEWLVRLAGISDIVVAAWGVPGSIGNRDKYVIGLLRSRLPEPVTIHHLGLTKAGHPKHPLYLKKTTPLQEWAGGDFFRIDE